MTDVRVPGDASPAVKAALAAFFGAAVRVVDEVPTGWDAAVDAPLMVVSDDGGPTIWPIWSEPLIRTTVYANGRQTAKDLRRTATGALFANVPAGMHIQRTGIGYTDARDPDTGADLASFTIGATVRTEVITV